MSAPIACFLIVPLNVDRLSLRRFSSSDTAVCPRTGYHNAEVFWKDEPHDTNKSSGYHGDPPKDDVRWPVKCDCGYAFQAEDRWQVFRTALYVRGDNSTQEIYTLSSAPPGAMWDAHWMPSASRRRPDGLCLVLRLPGNHDWMVDGPSRDGGFWTRSGSAPKITASPSILIPGKPGQPCLYHGWLRDGLLYPC